MYIGQTQRDLEVRIQEHIRDANDHKGFCISAAIAKYGWDNFAVDILAEVDDVSELNRLESYYIQQYDSVRKGYNLASGGSNNTMNDAAIKAKHDSVMRSPEVRKRISDTMKKHIKESGRTQEYANNLLKGLAAYQKSEKFKIDRAKFHLSPEHYKALNDAKNKQVYCVNELGEVVAEFDRVKDAADWWYNNGYGTVKDSSQLNDRIKLSATQSKYIHGLKWIYRV